VDHPATHEVQRQDKFHGKGCTVQGYKR
jgi:hypothetical protein